MSNTVGEKNRIGDEPVPRAMVHKKILDAAKENPDKSIEGLASQIDGATVQLVERVLDEYGDPASSEDTVKSGTPESVVTNHQIEQESIKSYDHSNEQTMDTEDSKTTATSTEAGKQNSETPSERSNETEESSDITVEPAEEGAPNADSIDSNDFEPTEVSNTSEEQSTPRTERSISSENNQTQDNETDQLSGDPTAPDLENLSQKRLEVLRAIRESPHATQAELADQLNVSRATISQRVNAIEGFDWSDRLEFVRTVFDESGARFDHSGSSESTPKLLSRLEDIEHRLEMIDDAIDTESDPTSSTFNDPELVATVVRACVDSEYVTEDQEERIIVELIGN